MNQRSDSPKISERCSTHAGPVLGAECAGSVWTPTLTRLLGHVTTRSKKRSKEWKIMTKLLRSSLGQIEVQVTRGHQRSNFAFLNIFFKSAHNSGTRRATCRGKAHLVASLTPFCLRALISDLRLFFWPPASKNAKMAVKKIGNNVWLSKGRPFIFPASCFSCQNASNGPLFNAKRKCWKFDQRWWWPDRKGSCCISGDPHRPPEHIHGFSSL